MTATIVPLSPTRAREFRPGGEGRYILEVPELAIVLDLDRLRRDRGALHGELLVTCGMPGTRSQDGVLFVGNVNASSVRDLKDLAGHLSGRANAPSIDWSDLLGDLFGRTLAAERAGKPVVMLRDIARPAADEDLEVDGIRLLRRHPVIAFGDGGAAKSYLALYLSTRLSALGLRVLYADWEFAGEDHRDRLERLTGEDMPDVRYVRCERPMTAEADRLRRIVREEAIDYIVCDSVAFAADGPPEAAEVAGAYFRALRQLGIGSLNIAHTTKAEGGDQKPFGSTFWHNGARATWYVKRAADEHGDGGLSIALFNRKANLGPLRGATGYRVEFGPDRTTFLRQSVAEMGADVAGQLPLSVRMATLLGRQGAMTAIAIAQELDAKVDSVMKTARRGDGKRYVRVPGADGVYRIGLAARAS
jgi:hypothetical protein